MFKLFKKTPKTPELKITWKWIDEDKVEIEYGNSSGLAALECDPFIEVLWVEKVA